MQMPARRPTSSGLDFGATVDSPNVNFITAIDINNEEIRIPYASQEITIDSLIHNYLQHTSCRQKIKGEPCFMIRNGPFKDEIAVKSYKLSSLGFNNLQEPCLTVLNKPPNFQESVIKSKSKVLNLNSLQVVPIILLIQGKQIKYEIINNDTVFRLKAKLINTFVELKPYNQGSIKLMYNGFALFNEESKLNTYGIPKGSIISVIIKNNQGCFKKTCLITCVDHKKVPISEVKIGDIILSYNSQKNQLEQDKVVYIHTTVLQQSTVIKLQNGFEIETTSNHRFLCADNQYRKIQFSLSGEQTLKRGSILKLGNGKEAAIQSIRSKAVYPEQQFYHLCIQTNHNFVVDDFIAHNMYINLRISKNQNERIDVNPTSSIADIKEQIELIYYKSMKSIRLKFAGRQLRDQSTLSDANMTKDSTLSLLSKKSQQFNYIFGETKILKFSGEYVSIRNIKQGDEITTYDPINNCKSKIPGKVIKISTAQMRDFMKIYLNPINSFAMVCPDSYLELQNGKAMHVKDIYSIPGGHRSKLKNIQGDDIVIHAMSLDREQMAEKFYRLQLDYSSNYIVQGAIIHNLVLNFAIKIGNQPLRKITFGVNSDTTILQVKNKMKSLTGIPLPQQVFTFNNIKLEDQTPIYQYNLLSQHLIVVTVKELFAGKSSIILDSQQIQNLKEKKINLIFSSKQKIVINYHLYAQRKVQEIIKELVPNCKSSYFLIFDELLIYPQQLLSRLQESESFKLPENEVIVVKNEKLAFLQNMALQAKHIQSHSHILYGQIPSFQNNTNEKSQIKIKLQKKDSQLFEVAISRISQIQVNEYKKQRFYQPFLYYTSHEHNKQISQYIRNFQKHRNEVNKPNSTYSIIKNLYVNMQLLPNYVGECFIGLRNFKFSKFFHANQVFYWHSFTSARKNDKEIINDLNQQVGTLFYINSLTGKEIQKFSLYPKEGEILFSPFSYFLVTKIQQGGSIDKVWLDEIPSPITFQKNIIVWVDGQPLKQDNKRIKLMIDLENMQVLQLTSTAMAVKWMKQFGWLLNWKGIQFKLISNMKRNEGQPKQFKQSAGIDLLESLYNLNGFTAKTLIFCGDEKDALKKAKARNIEQSRYQITQFEKVVEDFVKEKN